MNGNQVAKAMQEHVNKLRDELLVNIVEKATKTAQRNFNNFEPQASTDFPHVNVQSLPYSHQHNTITSGIICKGYQVVFIEFGVGIDNQFVPAKDGNDKPALGFDKMGKEIAERPEHVVKLGHYGKGHGMDEWWVRPSMLGIPNTNIGERQVHIRDKTGKIVGFRNDVVWTSGHKPARALWRAVREAVITRNITKYLGGK